jgi:nucleotide-binding universal stress UspA family protein
LRIVALASSTPEGMAGVEFAVEETLLRRAALTFVAHVPAPREEITGEEYAALRQQRAAEFEPVAARVRGAGLICEIEVPAGHADPADAVIEVAAALEAGLVVVGMRRRSRVGKLLLGSITQKVLLAVDCPVLAVKPSGDSSP